MHKVYLLLLLIISSLACQSEPKVSATDEATANPSDMPLQIDWQGHRGARGLLPENTIPAFRKALEFSAVKTLEMDVVISKDGEVVVSHEPWLSAEICSHPEGRPVSEDEVSKLNIYEMTLAEIQDFDCGLRGNPRFPEQERVAAVKPTLNEVISAAEAYAKELDRPLPHYNIELKSRPAWDRIYTPLSAEFVELVWAVIEQHGVEERVTIQSFDPRILQAMHQLNTTARLALLVENTNSLEDNLASLGFQPDIYSPYFLLCTPGLLDSLHHQGISLVPWTVNEQEDMRKLLEMGVDGIITDYPNLISEL